MLSAGQAARVYAEKMFSRQIDENPVHCLYRCIGVYVAMIAHGLECKKARFVIQRHDEIMFELQDLAGRSLVHLQSATSHTSTQDVEETEGMSDLIRDIWKHQTDCIMDVRITNLDAASNIYRQPEAVSLLFHCVFMLSSLL